MRNKVSEWLVEWRAKKLLRSGRAMEASVLLVEAYGVNLGTKILHTL